MWQGAYFGSAAVIKLAVVKLALVKLALVKLAVQQWSSKHLSS